MEKSARRWGSAVIGRQHSKHNNRSMINAFSPLALLFFQAISTPQAISSSFSSSSQAFTLQLPNRQRNNPISTKKPSLLSTDHALLHEILIALGTIVECNRQG